jgi:hypothetical protein
MQSGFLFGGTRFFFASPQAVGKARYRDHYRRHPELNLVLARDVALVMALSHYRSRRH